MEESIPLKRMAEEINSALASARITGARLEKYGDLIVLREGRFVYALGLLDNGKNAYFNLLSGEVRG